MKITLEQTRKNSGKSIKRGHRMSKLTGTEADQTDLRLNQLSLKCFTMSNSAPCTL